MLRFKFCRDLKFFAEAVMASSMAAAVEVPRGERGILFMGRWVKMVPVLFCFRSGISSLLSRCRLSRFVIVAFTLRGLVFPDMLTDGDGACEAGGVDDGVRPSVDRETSRVLSSELFEELLSMIESFEAVCLMRDLGICRERDGRSVLNVYEENNY